MPFQYIYFTAIFSKFSIFSHLLDQSECCLWSTYFTGGIFFQFLCFVFTPILFKSKYFPFSLNIYEGYFFQFFFFWGEQWFNFLNIKHIQPLGFAVRVQCSASLEPDSLVVVTRLMRSGQSSWLVGTLRPRRFSC